jgi:hypothetical protein
MTNANVKHADYQNLLEASWRRPLTPVEQDQLRNFLAAHPQCQATWDQDAALNRLLQRLPTAAVSTNFTARVLEAAQRLPAWSAWRWRLPLIPWVSARWLPRAVLAAAMICCGLFSFHEYQVLGLSQIARALPNVSPLAARMPIDWLQNFPTINRLNKVKVADMADDDLLVALHAMQ